MMRLQLRFFILSTLFCSALVLGGYVLSLASMSPEDEAAIMAGVRSSDVLFYKIAGAILLVLAGQWGFKKVLGMLHDDSDSYSSIERMIDEREEWNSDNPYLMEDGRDSRFEDAQWYDGEGQRVWAKDGGDR